MYYTTDKHHGLKHNPFNALIVPRPIGWISTIAANGDVNLAPFSFFNAVAYTPPMVMFACNGPHAEGGIKDSLHNIRETGEFVVNIVSYDQRHAMNATSAPAARNVDEFGLAGLEALPSNTVSPPRVAGSPAHLECVLEQIVSLPCTTEDSSNNMVIGRVTAIHIDDAVIRDGRVDISLMRPLSRLGYMDYAVVDESFELQRPEGG